jgi:hypothetical protein
MKSIHILGSLLNPHWILVQFSKSKAAAINLINSKIFGNSVRQKNCENNDAERENTNDEENKTGEAK